MTANFINAVCMDTYELETLPLDLYVLVKLPDMCAASWFWVLEVLNPVNNYFDRFLVPKTKCLDTYVTRVVTKLR